VNKVRMLLADDHTVLRIGLRAFFEEQKDPAFEIVAEAASGEQAIELVTQHRPDLLLLDLSMPGMGGLETTLELKRRGTRTRILILTQFNEAIYLRRVLEAGANGYILKSARGDELMSAVRNVLSGGTYIDPSLAGTLLGAAVPPTEAGMEQSTQSAEDAYSRLTPREQQILKLIAEGFSNKEIASSLELAVKTVMSHRMNLMDKLSIHNRSKLVQFAIKVGLLPISHSQ